MSKRLAGPRLAGIAHTAREIRRLQSSNGKGPPGQWEEIGTSGLDILGGFIRAASVSELEWPKVYPLYNRLRRTDPELAIIRQIFVALVRDVQLEWAIQEDTPSDVQKRAQEFGEQALQDVEGGITRFLETLVSYVPFMGWGWWEMVPGLRVPTWRPPDDDPWRSRYDDGLVGVRRLGFRDHSSFHQWDFDDSGRLRGMVQLDPAGRAAMTPIPLDRSIHLTFGDPNNPEGLSPLEAVWRLERIKYALEIVQGIGFEHAAGHAAFNVERDLTSDDEARVKKAARAILTAQEGNYLALPGHIKAAIMDVPFQAAPALLEAIKYYGVSKLQTFIMQWAALSATTGAGSFAAKKEDTGMFLVYFNAMMAGFVEQLDRQLGNFLFGMNAQAFAGLEDRPHLRAKPIERTLDVGEITEFIARVMPSGFPLGDDDFLAMRRKSGFLPESLPEVAAATPEPAPKETASEDQAEADAEEGMDEMDTDMAMPGAGRKAVQAFAWWAKRHAPAVYRLLGQPFPTSGSEPDRPAETVTVRDLVGVVREFGKALASRPGTEPIHVHLPESLQGSVQLQAPESQLTPETLRALLQELLPRLRPQITVQLPAQPPAEVHVEPRIEVHPAPPAAPMKAPDVNVTVTPEITIAESSVTEEIEVIDRDPEGRLKKARKRTTRRAKLE